MPKLAIWKIVSGLGVGAYCAFLFYLSLCRIGAKKGEGIEGKKLEPWQVFAVVILGFLISGGIAITALVQYAPDKHGDPDNRPQGARDSAETTANARYVLYLKDRFSEGKQLIGLRREKMRSEAEAGEQRRAIRKQQLEDALHGAPVFHGDRNPEDLPAPYHDVFPWRFEALDKFEASYIEMFNRLLTAAKAGDFVRTHELLKDVQQLIDSQTARDAFDDDIVVFLNRGVLPGGTQVHDTQEDSDRVKLKLLQSSEQFRTSSATALAAPAH